MSEAHLPRLPLLTVWHRLVQEEDRVVLEYGGEAVCFEGRATRSLLPALLPLLDGTRTVDEIASTLGQAAEPAIRHALDLLAANGLLSDGPPLDMRVPQPFAAAVLQHVAANPSSTSPAAVYARLRSSRATLLGASAAAAEIARTLRLSGVCDVVRRAWADVDPAPGLVIAAPEPAELPSLSAWNERAVASGTPWLQVLPFNGRFSAIGPLFIPGETSCFECYRRRRASNVDYADEFWALERSGGGVADAPALTGAVSGIASIAALRWLLLRDPWVAGVMVALELGESLRLGAHAVYRLPRCLVCSDARDLCAPLPWAEAS
jgi:bacteriocin biosynthesis cyclodehydratase domain-containing protein